MLNIQLLPRNLTIGKVNSDSLFAYFSSSSIQENDGTLWNTKADDAFAPTVVRFLHM